MISRRFTRSHEFVLHKMIDIAGCNFHPMSTGDLADAIIQFLWVGAFFAGLDET